MYSTREVENNITFDKIFNLVDDYFVYCYYLGKEVKINKPICSPLREDKNPSWSLYRDKKGVLRYKDFATGDSGNVVTMLQKMENLNYNEALRKIWKDIILRKSGTFKKKSDLVLSDDQEENNIEIKRKNYTDKDIQYWNQYHITKETLKLYKVFPISTFWINEVQCNFFYTEKEPMFAYSIYDKYKIYRPYSRKKDKWRNNCTTYDVQGIEQLSDTGDLLIITKSLKDVMVLYELGYNAIAPQSENSSIPKVIIDQLKLRFKRIVILFDYDEGGIKGAEKLSEKYSIQHIYIPKHYLDLYSIKDVSDYIKEFDKESTLIMIKELLNENTNSQ